MLLGAATPLSIAEGNKVDNKLRFYTFPACCKADGRRVSESHSLILAGFIKLYERAIFYFFYFILSGLIKQKVQKRTRSTYLHSNEAVGIVHHLQVAHKPVGKICVRDLRFIIFKLLPSGGIHT